MSKSIEEFKQILEAHYSENKKLPYEKRDMCNPSTSAQLALYCLCDVFLGEKWCIGISQSAEQVNTAMLFDILYKHDRGFRKWAKRAFGK